MIDCTESQISNYTFLVWYRERHGHTNIYARKYKKPQIVWAPTNVCLQTWLDIFQWFFHNPIHLIKLPCEDLIKKKVRLTFFSKNPIWRPSLWYGHINFFSIGDNSKILFYSMGFSYPGNSKNNNDPKGVPMEPFGHF